MFYADIITQILHLKCSSTHVASSVDEVETDTQTDPLIYY